MSEKDFSQVVNSLLEEYAEQRTELKNMITGLETLRVKVPELIPDALTKRNAMFLEEKFKAATGIYNSILDVRKELSKILKDEIELRRKLKDQDDEDGEFNFDIRQITRQVEATMKEDEKQSNQIQGDLDGEKKEG